MCEHALVVTKQFQDATCVFCPERSSPSGEHVLPRWLMDVIGELDGPYTTYLRGEPILKRDGTPRKQTSLGRVKLPMCLAHNQHLEHRFESPSHSFGRPLFRSDGYVQLTAPQATLLGVWLLKTWLLLAHPAAVHPRDHSPVLWHEADPSLWSWIADESSPPNGLSVWLGRRDDEGAGPGSPRVLRLPRIELPGHSLQFQIYQLGLRSLDVTLAYHPGWAIIHPLEQEGRAVRLWPLTPARALDLRQLPAVPPRDTVWLEGPTLRFEPGRYEQGGLPPLDVTFDHLGFEEMISLGVISAAE